MYRVPTPHCMEKGEKTVSRLGFSPLHKVGRGWGGEKAHTR
jgi:hypothetical protein